MQRGLVLNLERDSIKFAEWLEFLAEAACCAPWHLRLVLARWAGYSCELKASGLGLIRPPCAKTKEEYANHGSLFAMRLAGEQMQV